MTILVVADHNNSTLGGATLNAVSAALEIGDDIDILVAGSECSGVANSASEIKGVRKIIYADSPCYAHSLAEDLAALVVKLAGDYEYFLVAATTTGKNVMPRVAALLDVGQISDIISVVSSDTFTRPIYAGNIIATVQVTDDKKVITVRTTGFDAASETGGDAIVEMIEAASESGLAAFVSEELTKSDRPELAAANIIVSGGRGVGSSENFSIIEALADKLGAAVGASRAAVDAGYVPNDYQVGQTGKVVAPDLYVAVGISGAIQHLAGMKDSKVIVAINKDEEAPIFGVADYGLVGDLFKEVPAMVEALDG
jgi:electron transfer flavoprotein alpha subunit